MKLPHKIDKRVQEQIVGPAFDRLSSTDFNIKITELDDKQRFSTIINWVISILLAYEVTNGRSFNKIEYIILNNTLLKVLIKFKLVTDVSILEKKKIEEEKGQAYAYEYGI
ncbi:hypothetical protein H8356DRAFT_1346875 [Neocallimastix lanati (nom. inval.)]|nr:hypothetical protein H8356DRAFT_1346875 [Neocallimastix sp. JGI-2020a]